MWSEIAWFLLAVLALLFVRAVVGEIRYYRRRGRWLRAQPREWWGKR